MTAPLRIVGGTDAEAIEGQIPPHDDEAERAVLSALLLEGAGVLLRVDFLRAEMFFSEAHRRIFEAALEVHAAGLDVDVATVGARLRDRGRFQQVGGAGYLAEVLEGSPAVQNARSHAEVVHERWRIRGAIQAAQRVVAEGYHGAPDAQAFLDEATASFGEIARLQPGKRVETNIDTLKRIVTEMRDACDPAKSTRSRGVPTGIVPYDEATLGLHLGQKTTVVALPRVGKTAFGLQVAMNVARRGVGVLFFSTEMTREELAVRQLANLASVDAFRIKQAQQKNTLSAEEWSRLSYGLSTLRDAGARYRVAIHDDTSVTVEDIATRARAHAERSQAVDGVPLGLLVVDYVQRLRPSRQFEAKRNASKYDQHAHATEMLKNLARELGVAVLELAQQKNTSDGKGGRPKPKLGDAAECSQIERSADNVLYLHRPSERDGRRVQGLLVKQRGGDEVEFDLTFERQFSRFEAGREEIPTSRQYVDDMPGEERWR